MWKISMGGGLFVDDDPAGVFQVACGEIGEVGCVMYIA